MRTGVDHIALRLPHVAEQSTGECKPLVVHVACLTFYPERSLKGNPEAAQCCALSMRS